MEKMWLRQRFLSGSTAGVCGARDALGHSGEPGTGTGLPGGGRVFPTASCVGKPLLMLLVNYGVWGSQHLLF